MSKMLFYIQWKWMVTKDFTPGVESHMHAVETLQRRWVRPAGWQDGWQRPSEPNQRLCFLFLEMNEFSPQVLKIIWASATWCGQSGAGNWAMPNEMSCVFWTSHPSINWRALWSRNLSTSKRDVLSILNLLPQHGVTGQDIIGHNLVYSANMPNGHGKIDPKRVTPFLTASPAVVRVHIPSDCQIQVPVLPFI